MNEKKKMNKKWRKNGGGVDNLKWISWSGSVYGRD